MKDDKDNGMALSFAAIDPAIDKLIVSARERRAGGEWVQWGDRNQYPFYVKGLCREVPTLRTVILGLIDYVSGDDVVAQRGLRPDGTFDRKGATARDIVKRTAKSIAELGGFAWKVTRNNDGTVGELEVLALENIRANEDGDVFWYSEKWLKGYGGQGATVTYPAFVPGQTENDESILYVKLWGDGTYPEPVYAASVKACETERAVDDFHLGNIERGFMGSYLVNFMQGRPEPKLQREIEKNFTEKFAGHRNAGRIMFNYCPDRDHMATLQKMEVADYGEKYQTLSKHCQQQIFTAFRANPNLFGVATESNGFNSEEYESAFKLFNRTMVLPIQRTILDAFDRVLGEKGVVSIVPFTLEGNGGNAVR